MAVQQGAKPGPEANTLYDANRKIAISAIMDANAWIDNQRSVGHPSWTNSMVITRLAKKMHV